MTFGVVLDEVGPATFQEVSNHPFGEIPAKFTILRNRVEVEVEAKEAVLSGGPDWSACGLQLAALQRPLKRESRGEGKEVSPGECHDQSSLARVRGTETGDSIPRNFIAQSSLEHRRERPIL
jgi:hypothetical protein